ncbi:MAG: amidohydrolase family protein [Myxococcota bacterium]
MPTSAEIRERLPHPVIDVDGHYIELVPVLAEQIRDVADARVAERLCRVIDLDPARAGGGTALDDAGRAIRWGARMPWWGAPRSARDRVTAHVPAVLRGRLDELGIDVSILYPSLGLMMMGVAEAELRQAGCRALNRYQADLLAGLGDRLLAPAAIPIHTPEEAIAELDYCVGTLGYRTCVVTGSVRRVRPELREAQAVPAPRNARFDWLGVDSEYDYDPFWRRCVELGVSVTCHGGSMGTDLRESPSRYMFNHIGHFAANAEAFAKALYMGGVTRRFPALRFGFLEGGVGWGVQLLAALADRWSKRGGPNIAALDPDRLDWREVEAGLRAVDPRFAAPDVMASLRAYAGVASRELDDFAAAGIGTLADVPARFVDAFFFGCEADDPINLWAFDRTRNPFGVKLRAMLGSDVGHWDVVDMAEVVEEAHESVERGLLGEDDFRDFVCDNAIRLHAHGNPDFFAGTIVESYAKERVSKGSGA